MKENLLSDETTLTLDDIQEREELVSFFSKLPVDFFSKMRHFQPQIGCLNACSICSKYASSNMAYWDESRIRNVVAALKYSTPANELPLIVWDRSNHRNGVIFAYLDNDIGNYLYLDKFIDIVYRELGTKTRISTVGYSRHNNDLNIVHQNVANNSDALAGVRLSFTPYEIGWKKCNSNRFSRSEYEDDIANFLEIYKPYYEKVGSGSRNFCIELRYKPLVINSEVYILEYKNKTIIYSDKYLYISQDENIEFIDSTIIDAKVHRLSLNNDGIIFNRIELPEKPTSMNQLYKIIEKGNIKEQVKIYRVKNADGYYYSVSPQLTDAGNYGINFYPKTETREKSGYIILERFFLNELFKYKKENGLKVTDNYINSTWNNVDDILNRIIILAANYKKEGDCAKYEYINNELFPLIKTCTNALNKAGYSASTFFDKSFIIDTGAICNLGRAIKEFRGLVSIENEPLTLNHERNYGKNNSTMTIESDAWRLSCGYNDEIIVEKMNLANTATIEGQVEYRNSIALNKRDISYKIKSLNNEYLIPGQRRR